MKYVWNLDVQYQELTPGIQVFGNISDSIMTPSLINALRLHTLDVMEIKTILTL